MRWILTTAFLAVMPLSGAGVDVTGVWSVEVRDTPQGVYHCEVKIHQDGGQLAGEKTCGERGPFEMVEIKMNGNKLSFKLMPGARTVTVKAEVNGDALEGTWEIDDGQTGPYVGKRK